MFASLKGFSVQVMKIKAPRARQSLKALKPQTQNPTPILANLLVISSGSWPFIAVGLGLRIFS